MESPAPRTIRDVSTPCVLVSVDKAKKNAQKMVTICKELGVGLRPHMKTHKTLEFGELMTGGTKRCIVVSTLAEAEFYASGGFDDILYSMIATPDKLPRLRELTRKLEAFHHFVDSEETLDMFRKNPMSNDKKWSFFLKIDCKGYRGGVFWDSEAAVKLAQEIHASNFAVLRGLYVHEGYAYDSKNDNELKKVGDDVSDKLCQLRQKLQEQGIDCPLISCGSTPSCSVPGEKLKNIDEIHPGNYIFYDHMQEQIGSCRREEIAIRLATRVLGHYPNKGYMLVDCGFTALSKDGLNSCNGGFALVDGHPNLTLLKMTQEVGYVTATQGQIDFAKFPVGSVMYLIPWHACATACQHRYYHIHSGEDIVAKYITCSGW